MIGWGPAVVWAAVLFFMSAAEDPGLGVGTIPDKPAHVAAYAVLGLGLAWARERAHPEAAHSVFLVLGFAYGLSDEWHQSFVTGREAAVGDWISDVVGVVVGYAALQLWARRRALSGDAT